MIHAELRREQSGQGYYTLRYLVFNGDVIGSYGVHYNVDQPYGASRDFHRLATTADFASLKEDGSYVGIVGITDCQYHDNKPSICDGSSLVEITDNEQRAFEIAAMMAEVTRWITR
jgi:hypothetical protein